MKTLEFLKKDWLALLLLIAPVIMLWAYWNQLPDQVPTRWNIWGELDSHQSKTKLLYTLLGVGIFVYTILAIIPYIDPKRNAERILKPLRVVRIAVMGFLAIVFGGIILNGAGYTVNLLLIVKVAIILLYLILGNVMSKFPPNYFAGIRTPWTLEYPEIWRQVHRFGGKLWVAGALVLLIFVFLWDSFAYFMLFIAVTLILALVPTFYSYLLYRKIRQQGAVDTK
ncbi:MAG: SdpI family protein [Cyclobacteriaceae bacterium]